MYICIRLLIALLAAQGFKVILGKAFRLVRRKKYWIAYSAAFALFLCLTFLPFENLFVTFNSPEKAVEYYAFADVDVYANIPGEQCNLIVGTKTDTNIQMIVPRTENGWKIGVGTDTKNHAKKVFGWGTVRILRYSNTQDYFVEVLCTDGEAPEIIDSQQSVFVHAERESSEHSANVYYAHLSCFDQNYWISVNGERIIFD